MRKLEIREMARKLRTLPASLETSVGSGRTPGLQRGVPGIISRPRWTTACDSLAQHARSPRSHCPRDPSRGLIRSAQSPSFTSVLSGIRTNRPQHRSNCCAIPTPSTAVLHVSNSRYPTHRRLRKRADLLLLRRRPRAVSDEPRHLAQLAVADTYDAQSEQPSCERHSSTSPFLSPGETMSSSSTRSPTRRPCVSSRRGGTCSSALTRDGPSRPNTPPPKSVKRSTTLRHATASSSTSHDTERTAVRGSTSRRCATTRRSCG